MDVVGGNYVWLFFGSDVVNVYCWIVVLFVVYVWCGYDVWFLVYVCYIDVIYYLIESEWFD